MTRLPAAAAHMGGAAAAVVWWDEAAQLAVDAEHLRTQVLGLSRRVASHYGSASVPAALAVDAGQTAAAGLLGMKRLLDGRGL